jgi:CheY-like chemotaxis protein
MAATAVAHLERSLVVVIDDSSADLRWFELVAQETGLRCAVKTYTHTIAALEELRRGEFKRCSAVFVSAVFPWMSLEEACVEIRSIEGLAETPIIAMIDGEYEVEIVKRAGLKHWIWKPVEGSTLCGLLDYVQAPASAA